MKADEIINLFAKAPFKARHGDVVIIRDDNARGEEILPGVLAEGEVTGHAHRITRKNDAEVRRIAGETVQRLLNVVAEKAYVDHEEHMKSAMPKGMYRSGIQAQWTPDGLKRVAD